MKFAAYKGLDLAQTARDQRAIWEAEELFQQSVDQREGAPSYVFFEGPPSANGMPGIHHVMARTIKDIFPRYKTMKGFQVLRKAGWDTHGLPIELGVEKELGITKEDIGTKISVTEYNEACRKAVMRYTDVWNELTQQVGYWVDMDHPYVTYEPKYMESVWWLLKQIYEKGLMYKGYTIQPYSPKAGTGLSSHELNQPGTYQDVTDTTITAMFEVLPEGLPQALVGIDELYVLAWTTTPWTLPSNTALTVGPKIKYAVVHTYNQYTFAHMAVILAEALIAKQFTGKYVQVEQREALAAYTANEPKIPYWVGDTFLGTELAGIRYAQLIPGVLPFDHPENAFRVISGDFVTTEDGTGVVHTAPTFGADDALVSKQAVPEIPPMLVQDEHGQLVPLVDLQGRFRPEVGLGLAGKYVKNAYYPEGEAPEQSVDVEIAIALKTQNRAFKVEKYVHSYPNCWRTDKPILYYPLDSWFIKATQVRERMHELNQTINWKPKATGEGRFGHWLANANDWNLSRSRYWGIPLPIWRSADGAHELMIGSVAELIEAMNHSVELGLMEKNIYPEFVPGDFSEENYAKLDLHKNFVDQIVLAAPDGSPMYREADLIDVWFDSGSMPYAQWHYPFENKELIDNNAQFPADFIAEGVDQTRGWFYTLHAIATMVFDSVAYKNVVSNGMVLDKDGKKMSKRLGNAIDPFEIIDQHGPDATRWYMIANANPWDNLKFDPEGVAEVKRKFFGTLYNTYSFLALYANVDQWTNQEAQVPVDERPEIDRWILSALNSLVHTVDQAYGEYEPTRAARAISEFVQEHLSNWYVRLCRRRFWKSSYGTDKIAAYQTLYQCLETVALISAPIAPFYMDQLYRDLTTIARPDAPSSVHLALFPAVDQSLIDQALEQKMELAQQLCSLTLSIRQKEKIKVRQPLQRLMVPVQNDTDRARIEAIADLVKAEVNVKELVMVTDQDGILVKQIKANFKTLGPKYGQDMKAIAAAIGAMDASSISHIEQYGTFDLDLGHKIVTISAEDVLITAQDIEGWLVASEGGQTVALDITLSPELVAEGITREMVNRLQNLRKDSGLAVTDHIVVRILKDGIVETAINANLAYLMNETLAKEVIFEDQMADGLPITFDDVNTQISIQLSL